MMTTTLSAPADAYSPDPDRDGTGASARLPGWLAHIIALVIRFLLERTLTGRSRHAASLPSPWHDRPNLTSCSVPQRTTARRGHFGNTIAWTDLRRGTDPAHPNCPDPRDAIIAVRGSIKRFRPGLPARRLQWREDPQILSRTIGDTAETPSAEAVASRLSRQATAGASSSNLVSQAVPAGQHLSLLARAPAPGPNARRGDSANRPAPVRDRQFS